MSVIEGLYADPDTGELSFPPVRTDRDGRLSMVGQVEEIPTYRSIIDPTISGITTPEIVINGDLTTATDQPILLVRFVVNPFDKLTAAGALKSGVGNVRWVFPGGAPYLLRSDMSIRQVAVIAIGTAAQPADYTGGAYICSAAETDLTDWRDQLALFDFLGSTPTREVAVTLSPTYANGLAARLKVQGVGYAT